MKFPTGVFALALGVSSLSLLSKALDTPRDSASGNPAIPIDAASPAPAEQVGTVALAGIRPIALNCLWVRSIDAFRERDWTEALAIYRAIAFLQPRCEAAWLLNGWNLAYNLAIDRANRGLDDEAVTSVLAGIDFLRAGIRRNPGSIELRSYLAWVLFDRGSDPMVAAALRSRGDEPLDAAIDAAREATSLEGKPTAPGEIAAYWLAFYLIRRSEARADRAGAIADLDEALAALDRIRGPLAERSRDRRSEVVRRREALATGEDRS